jgi:chaperone BCS1
MMDLSQIITENPIVGGVVGAGLVGFGLAALKGVPQHAFRLARRMTVIEAEFLDNTEPYYWVRSWLARRPEMQKTRTISVTDMTRRDEDELIPRRAGSQEGVKWEASMGVGAHFLMIGATPVIVNRSRLEKKSNNAPGEQITLIMPAWSRGTLFQIVEEAACLAHQGGIKIYAPDTYSGWYAVATRPARDPETVVLQGDIMRDLIEDVRSFQEREEWYAQRGIPYRRGIALFGPPGTGKTSAIEAACGHLGLNICPLSLASVTDDNKLAELMRSAPKSAAVVIEDIDAMLEGRTVKSSKESALTFSGILNAIDGLSSAHGRILFVTSNHPETLDPALLRPGRIDRTFTIGNATREQARRMFLRFFPDQEIMAGQFADAVPDGASMAAVQGALIQNQGDPVRAVLSFARPD